MKENNKKNNIEDNNYNTRESLVVILVGILFFGNVIFAEPSSTPPSGNPDIPINALALPQYKEGEATNGYVNRALGVGYTPGSLPVGVTLGVFGQMKIGTLSGTSDGMSVFGDMRDINTTVLCQTSHTYSSHSTPCGAAGTNNTSDGNVIVTSLSGSGSSTSVCVQLDNENRKQLVRCP
ncbi:MAG: hypothetical protein NTX85_00860 [Candidatus Nomurabacteria bacterium]|nr:hypothetical protein [Candidatus Nomurabacteria bacterium]